ncbi:MAG TPA: tetratricopeptide repeat protein [Candidatus Bathyarchaeia archaeon]|nr:tetratricopeptide repeat protein [Candidatus Bathyarchaeia archaeon]
MARRRRTPPRPAAPAARPRRAEGLIAVAVACGTWIVFLPALRGAFLSWDDHANFVTNRAWRGLGAAQLGWIFTNFHMGHWIPVTWLSFSVDYLVWGMQPSGYHLTNVLLHAANAGLACIVTARLMEAGGVDGTARLVGAAFAALAFALHPLRVESVAWVTERRDVLSTFFFLLAFLAYLRVVRRAPAWRHRAYWLALGSFVLALGSKSITVTLPVILIIADIYPLRRWTGAWRTRLAEKAPFFALSLLAGVVSMIAVREGGSASTLADLGIGGRLAITAYSLVFYPWKSILPVRLSPLYELPVGLDPLAPVYVASAVGLVALSGAALALRRRAPWLLAAWAAYLVMALPISGLVQNGPQIAADRYTYLPCLPLAMIAGLGVAWLARWPWVLAAPAAALAALALLTVTQIGIWRDTRALWTHALAVAPSAIAYSSMGVVLDEDGEPQAAVAHFKDALRINPRLAHAQNNWGIALARQGQWQEALAHYEEALRLNPAYTEARLNLAVALDRLGRSEEAQREVARARAPRP